MSRFRAPPGSFLDDETIMRYAPSVFTPLKHPERSDAYRHVPTAEILGHLRERGFAPVQVSQSGGPTADSIRGLFARHALRLRHAELPVVERGDLIPELLLLNAHDGSGSYELSAGLFRVICLNGMVAGAGDLFRVAVRHSGAPDLPARVLDASYRILGQLPNLLERVNRLREVNLPEDRRLRLARAALRLVPSSLRLDASELLTPRRPEDQRLDAWTTLNVIQENVMRGGVPGHTRSGSRRHTAPIADVATDARVNRALWDLAEAA